ncbi:hypothetical protein Mp_2g25610 [Marchantia polymorpha subsp. ruderalis]|uniref:Uncharacterized protein n=1 Tax=Marchantia polymorpha TaxID=3197 RepID=A0A2R6XBD6_MARPO|nr:hypothetical protein MARPO_0025s0118 [Marchantia polymorpha]BBN03697.1 hypothetical protein Mp_2g25610 [Marchantia polymorpha subsp. ruderalis]|eukprot:PTQ43436.1 hypothetical protein MARPO_0025s0118 [Marchantia polymorpha]
MDKSCCIHCSNRCIQILVLRGFDLLLVVLETSSSTEFKKPFMSFWIRNQKIHPHSKHCMTLGVRLGTRRSSGTV